MGYSGKGTEAEIEQRQEAAKSHGAYAFRDRGEETLTVSTRSRLEELKEKVQDRAGVLELMQERAANAVMMVELVTGFVGKEVKSGKQLSQISALDRLPAFMNTAQRALKDLISVMPNDKDALDALNVLEAVRDGQKDERTD